MKDLKRTIYVKMQRLAARPKLLNIWQKGLPEQLILVIVWERIVIVQVHHQSNP